MNQFKKAKQKALESGHHIENISDLKTAGVVQPIPEPNESQKTTSNQNTETIKVKNTPKKMLEPAIEEDKKAEDKEISLSNSEVNIIQSQESLSKETIAKSSQINTYTDDISNDSDTLSNIQSSNLPEHTESDSQDYISTNDLQQSEPVLFTEETITKTDIQELDEPVTPQQIQPVFVNQNSNIPSDTQQINRSPYIYQQTAYPNDAQQVEQQTYRIQESINSAPVHAINQAQLISQEPVTNSQFQVNHPNQEQITRYSGTGTKNTSSKKSIPNIFSPKGEAKSMRKSLVLKPTSVKIAENYCAKNGGSFNELIQTLLDNFIDEYGL